MGREIPLCPLLDESISKWWDRMTCIEIGRRCPDKVECLPVSFPLGVWYFMIMIDEKELVAPPPPPPACNFCKQTMNFRQLSSLTETIIGPRPCLLPSTRCWILNGEQQPPPLAPPPWLVRALHTFYSTNGTFCTGERQRL